MNNHSSVKSKELFSIREFLIKYNPLLILLGLIIISSILSPYFLTVQNTFNVLKQQVVYSLIAMGVMLTLMSGGIDLSVASTAGISGVIVPIVLTNWGMDGAGGFIFAILFAIFHRLFDWCYKRFSDWRSEDAGIHNYVSYDDCWRRYRVYADKWQSSTAI